jgi:hypothetical protein
MLQNVAHSDRIVCIVVYMRTRTAETQTMAAPIMLVTTAHPSLHEHPGPNGEPVHPMLGRLIQPRHTSSIEATAAAGIPWAADNDCFQGLDRHAFTAMLDRIAGLPGCLFVSVPDHVGDAHATAESFDAWAPELEARGLPCALVLQDGIDELGDWLDSTWDRLAAVFVGGTDDFKLGPVAAELAREAKRRGKWVHWGRVSSRRRIRHIAETGAADSFDCSSWATHRKCIVNKRTRERAAAQGRPVPPAIRKLEQGLAWCVETAKAAARQAPRPVNVGGRFIPGVAGASPEADERTDMDTDLLDTLRRHAAEADARERLYRELAAEFRILMEYDARRSCRYGDYGGGQRQNEISRRQHELSAMRRRDDFDEREPTVDELRAAFRRVGRPRLRRLRRERDRQATYLHHGHGTRPTRESLRAWLAIENELNLRVDNEGEEA